MRNYLSDRYAQYIEQTRQHQEELIWASIHVLEEGNEAFSRHIASGKDAYQEELSEKSLKALKKAPADDLREIRRQKLAIEELAKNYALNIFGDSGIGSGRTFPIQGTRNSVSALLGGVPTGDMSAGGSPSGAVMGGAMFNVPLDPLQTTYFRQSNMVKYSFGGQGAETEVWFEVDMTNPTHWLARLLRGQ
jgi:hypothetical protein